MKSLAHVEISDPHYESTNLRYASCDSSALNARGQICLFVPPMAETERDVPVVVLLHGVNGSHWSWPHQGGAHHTAMRMMRARDIRPMVMVMPSDGSARADSAYVPHGVANYEQWVGVEAVDVVMGLVHQVTQSSPVFLAGLSMGGFGALRLAAKYPFAYAGAAAHSPITRLSQLGEFTSYASTSPTSIEDDDGSIHYWMERHARYVPPITFDCGRQDSLVGACRELHRDLQVLGVAHSYEEPDGDHSWNYWAQRLRNALRFFDNLT
ncbi:MAG: alpha/beta hydrolase [Acidimicrobiia bacterium]